MGFITKTFKTYDDETIFYYHWQVKDGTEPKGVIQIAHGIGEHTGRYKSVAKKLQKDGFEVYANDHRIHGHSIKNDDYLGYYDGDDFFDDAMEDMYQLTEIIKKEHPNKKIILFGHSLGSLLSKNYVTKYGDELAALILSGTASFMKGVGTIGYFGARFIGRMNGKHRSNEVLKNIFFKRFNKHFKPNRTKVDWISSDEKQVDKFEADPLRIEDFSLCVFADIIKGSKIANEKITFKKTPKHLPIYIFSGDKDPVGEMGKGVKKVAKRYKRAGVKDVTLKLYKGGSAEMLNEVNKKEVVQDLLIWLNSKITK